MFLPWGGWSFMKHIYTPGGSAKFTEQELLHLHDIFLTPGIHTLRLPTIAQGREIVNLLLNSLNYYTNIGCLTVEPLDIATECPAHTTNIHQKLVTTGYLKSDNQYDKNQGFKEFIATDLYNDFIWIESTDKLNSSHYFDDFKHELHNQHIDRQTPILVLEYHSH